MRRPHVATVALGGLVGVALAALGLGAGLALGVLPGAIVSGLAAAAIGAAGAWLVDERAARRAASPSPPGDRPAIPDDAPEVDHGPEWDMPARLGGRDGGRTPWAELREAVREIAEAAEILDSSSRRMADGASDQGGTVTRTTNTVEALSDRIDRISQNAEEAADATEGTRQQAMRGLEQIQGIIGGMDRLRSLVEANVRKARRLGERSVEIGSIVKLIDEISSRTDMLALNATIESVRAGDHGRGFAVVAEEIRKLAERTAVATREIGTLVEAIQADTHESIRALAEEEAQMEDEARHVREAGSALERISRMAEESARLVDGISHSANDQVLAARDLVAGMQRFSDLAKLILGETTQIRQESRALIARCDRLRASTGTRSGAPEAGPALIAGGPTGRLPSRPRHPLMTEGTP